MASSQFTIYTSNDPQGPGVVVGQTGSLTNILDACLVYGYGTGSYYKAPAGWTKPLPNISASVGSLPQLACYKQASGSGFTLFINDAAPTSTQSPREAWACGYESITTLTGSVGSGSLIYTGSYGIGTGYGQFPLPSQLLTYGHVNWRKSNNADNGPRFWMIAADAYTMYMWILTTDNAGYYNHFGFGDIYSFAGASDKWRCFIYGRAVENSTGGPSNDFTGMIAQGAGYLSGQVASTTLSSAFAGHFLARTLGGSAGSTPFCKKGDPTEFAASYATPCATYMAGAFQTPNGSDNSFYIHPLQIVEPSTIMLRGRFRGLFYPCHPISNVNDGQVISGGGDYAGKTFTAIKYTVEGGGAWLLETSPTVETN